MKYIVFALSLAWAVDAAGQRMATGSFAAVNSTNDEQNPVISPDGKTLWFTVANHPQNVAGKKDTGDIWYSTLAQGKWSIPVHAGNVINDRGYNGVAGFSRDGEQMFLFNHYGKNGEPARTQGISVTRRSSSGWSAPENISIPYFQNKALALSGQVSSDGRVFVYSAEAYDSRGAEDIYVSLKDDQGRWTEPRNVGLSINTPFQELTPWLSADSKTLYFSSNGRKGYGSFDVYFTERQDESWTRWSAPVNAGSRINSEGRELFYHTFPAMQLALFTTTQNSDGYGDIRFYNDSISMGVPDTLIRIVEIKRENQIGKDDKHSVVKGTVTNSKSGIPIVAKLDFKSDSLYSTNSNKQGSYKIRISSTSVYSIVVEAPGYVGVLEKLDIHTFEMDQVELNFKLQPIEIGATVNLKNVLFQVATTNLLTDSYDELNVVVDLLRTNPKIEIELAGHTDNRGDAHLNLKLSQERVDKVKTYLVSKGISAKRIRGKGYGGKRPIASSDSEESRKLNRRVEFTIVKD